GVVVRTPAGLCYEVQVGAYALPELRALMGAKEPVELHTYHYIEGTVAIGQLTPRLVGFLSAAEREFFLHYIKAPGLSPRSAIRSLTLPPERIAAAIAGGSLAVLTKLPGIGKKKAEQIISKLQEEISELALGAEAAPAGPGPPKIVRQRAEAMGVLVGQLGYRTPEAEDLIERAAASLGEEATTEGILQEVFRLSR
ncbi:MAG: Holliday junction branch migration protein RuvA, partial [bacterium]